MDLWDTILPPGFRSVFHADNTAEIDQNRDNVADNTNQVEKNLNTIAINAPTGSPVWVASVEPHKPKI